MTSDTPWGLLAHRLRGIYAAEMELFASMAFVRATAHNFRLADIIASHRLEVEEHIVRIENCFSQMELSAGTNTCPGLRGLVEEAVTFALEEGPDHLRDAELVANCQRIVQFMLAMYEHARILAHALDETVIVRLLDRSIAEERATDAALFALIEAEVYPAMVAPTGEHRPQSPWVLYHDGTALVGGSR